MFDGWYTDEACTQEATFGGTITKNTNYYAKYVPLYTVTYTDGVVGEVVFANQEYTVPAGSATPAFVGTPTRKNYDFIGWEPRVADTVTADVTYVAQWQPSVADYTVEYYLQDVGADGKPVSTYTLQNADTETKSGPIGSAATYDRKSYTNYTFKKAEPANPTIKADGSLVIEVYYTRDTADLTISKEVVDPTGEEIGSFPVTVTHGVNTTASGRVSPTSPMIVTGLAVGETFTVTEQANGATWTTTVGGADGTSETVTIAAGGNTVTFTNSRTLYNGDGRLTVKKEWKDGDKTLAAGLQPGTVNVTLMRNGAAYRTATLRKSDGWTHTFTNLPATDANGNACTYTVEEAGVQNGKVTLNGYRFTVSGVSQRCTTADVTITNTLDRVNVTVNKQWVLNGITLTEKPAVTFTLMQGENVIGKLEATDTADVYTLASVPYRTDYTVDETMSGGTAQDSDMDASTLFTPQTGVKLTGTTALSATVTNRAGKYGITISKTAAWDEGMDVTIPAFTFTVDGQTVTLTPAENGKAVSTQVLVSQPKVTVEETPVTGWTADATSLEVQAGGTAAFTNTRDTLPADQPLTITKVIDGNKVPAMADDTFDFTVTVPSDLKAGTQVTYTVAGGEARTTTVAADHTFVISGVKDGQTATVTSVLPTGTYSVQETPDAGNAHAYTAQVTHTGYAFTATNTPVTNSVTFTKLWEQPNGAQPANAAYGAANAGATFGLFDGGTQVAETTSAGGSVTFANVPTGANKTYTIRETGLSGADNYTVSSAVLTAVWNGEKFVLSEGNAITNPLRRAEGWTLSLTKQVTNSPAADSGATFTVRYSYRLPGAATAVTAEVTLSSGQTETVSLTLPVGTEITVEEVLGNAADVWDTYFKAGTAQKVLADSQTYTVTGTGLAVTIINDRVLYGGDGKLILAKTWVDNSDADKLRPDPQTFASWLTLYSKAGEGAWRVDTVSAPSVADDYIITYAGLPAYDLAGNAMNYAAAETVAAPYTLTYTKDEAVLTVADGVQAITSGGFINTLEHGLTITKLWRNSENTAIPAAQTTQVALMQRGTLIRTVTLDGMDSTQTASVSVPKYDANGAVYAYTIREVGANNDVLSVGDGITYTVAYDGLTITNTKAQPAKTAEASEVVNIDEGDGIITMVPVGATITFTIGYENYLPEAATVTVTDTLPVGLKFVAEGSTAGFTVDGQTVTWTLENVPALTSGKITLVAEVTEDALTDADPSVRNTASVTLGHVTESTTTTDNRIYNPDWTVEKTLSGILRNDEELDGLSKVLAGDVLTYAITVTNTGNCDLTDLEVEDTFQVDGEVVELALVDEACGKDPASFGLAKGEAVVFTATYTVEADDKQLINTAKVGDEGSTVDTTVEDNPLWTVEKTIAAVNGKEPDVDQVIEAGDVLTYAITVANTGNCDLPDLEVEDTFQVDGEDVTLTLMDEEGGKDPAAFSLGKGETVTFTATYTVEDDDKQLTNTAKVGDETSTVDTDVEDNPQWTLDKALADKEGNPITGEQPSYQPGDTVFYVITAVNTGNVALTDLTISDLFLVDGADMTDALIADADLTAAFDLDKGETKTFHASYVVKATDKVLSNTVTSDGKEDEVITEVEDAPAWTVEKYVLYVNGKEVTAEQTYNVGDKVTYAIVVTNAGNCDVQGLKAEDLLSGAADMNLKLTGTQGENPDSFTLPRYANEQKQPGTVTFLAVYTLQKADKVVTNLASIDKPDDGKDPETDEVVITVEDYPDVEVIKTVDNKGTGKDGAFRGGDTIRYKVEVRNTGNCLLEDLKVEDVFEVDGLLTDLKLEPATGRFDLEAGESKVFYASYVIKDKDTCLVNEATVSNGDVEDGDRVIITTEPNPSVTVLKEVTNIGYGLQGAFLPGDEVDYRVTVTNTGNCDLYDLTLTDSLYGDSTRLKITLPEEAASFNLMKGETIVFKYSYRTQEGYSLLVNTAKVLDASSRVKTRIVTDPISPAAMPPAYGCTSNVGDCFD
ncbi:MAG: Cna B-type domain-containing protein [Eubacteriales bacterium]|nr:Cna B-type domain-containing protein [Eubacteriales bacterium]